MWTVSKGVSSTLFIEIIILKSPGTSSCSYAYSKGWKWPPENMLLFPASTGSQSSTVSSPYSVQVSETSQGIAKRESGKRHQQSLVTNTHSYSTFTSIPCKLKQYFSSCNDTGAWQRSWDPSLQDWLQTIQCLHLMLDKIVNEVSG